MQPQRLLDFQACLLLAAVLPACGSSVEQTATAVPRPERVRYYADVTMPVAGTEDVEDEALAGARSFLVHELVGTGGLADPAARADDAPLPAFVFHVTVGTMEAHATGRTRASVSALVRTQDGGRLVGALEGTATAFVDRTAPLEVRQQRAIEGALQGAFQRWPELLRRLEREGRRD